MAKPKKLKVKLERGGIVKFPTFRFEKAGEQLAELHAFFEKASAKIRANPNADGWMRLCEILKSANEDKRIKSSAGASDFMELMLLLAEDAITASSAEEAIQPLTSEFISSNARSIANKGHEPRRTAKDWVVSEWMKYKLDYKNNKSFFARDYALRVKNERGVRITERTIANKWLKNI
ncbi:MAG: hypothetical protein H0U72_11305 [Nitrosospira sp.]|nr:hypothetical protein [Nitrosospira sp.]